jgi:ubiquinone/menaquinone biosynthesis C-methylase UbiE
MKNIINEKPSLRLHGRTKYSTQFILDESITQKNMLDIGCGYGWFELYALKNDCKRITGIEITVKDLFTAKNNIVSQKVNFQVGSGITLPFKNNSFDTVVSWEVLEHIPPKTELKMFKEVHRVLKVGGSFYMSTPHASVLSNIFDPAWWLIGHRHYSEKYILSFAKKSGFGIEGIVVKGKKWEILGVNNLYIAKWIFRRKPFFEHTVQQKHDKEYQMPGYTTLFIHFKRI